MEHLVQDLRYGIRTFIRQPAFALTAILALALGIGANTAVFSVIYAVLLKPLPFPDPAALVLVHDTYPAVFSAAISSAKFIALREGNRTLVAVGAMAPGNVTLTGRGEPEQVAGSRVSADFFKVLEVPAQYGRWFSTEEDAPNAEPVIVLSYALWQRRFGSDPRIVGTAIQVDGQSRMVVGVMPPGFTYPGQTLAWVPLGIPRNVAPAGNFLRLLGRMRKGITVDRVQADLARVSDAFNKQTGLQRDIKVWPLHEILVTNSRRALLVLQGAVAFVLLVACANVANLLLARSVGRSRELAIRTAVGAGRGRIFRQLLTESVLLSVAGGTMGVLLASWLLRLFLAVAPTNFPRAQTISLDTSVLVFTLALAVLTGVLFGVAPASRGFQTDPIDSLRDTGAARGATAGSARGASRVLVIFEVALALVLVADAGLMVKSLLNLERQDAGFQRNGLITFEIALPPARYPASAAAPVVQRMLDEIRGVPGVRSAGAINYLPIANYGFNGGFAIEGRPAFQPGTAPVVEYRIVAPGYFATMGIPFRRGEDFSRGDGGAGRPVVIINEAMATRYWPNANPIGARVQLGVDTGTVWREVVGVVGDVRSANIGTPPVPETFVPHAQVPANGMGIAIRTGELDPGRVLPAVRQRIAAIDASLPLVRVRSMDAIVEGSAGSTRMQSVLTSVFALVAALLAAVGVYSLIAYSVAQRTRELGIRVALGADRRAVLLLILGEGVTLASIGIGIGLGGAVLLTKTLTALLYEVSPTDPAVLALTCFGLLAVAAVASLLPAIRAVRVDPMTALRR